MAEPPELENLIIMLTGKIEFRLALALGDERGNDKSRDSRPQKNEQEKKAHLAVAGKKRPREESADRDNGSGGGGSWVHKAGYFFFPHQPNYANGCGKKADQSNSTSPRGYPIVYPFEAIDTICRAAMTKEWVQISKYDWINFGNSILDQPDDVDDSGEGDDISKNRSQGTTAASTIPTNPNIAVVDFSARVLEIHEEGIRIVGSEQMRSDHENTGNSSSSAMTLAEFAKYEEQLRSTKTNGQVGRSSSERHSIMARIDATSAIIAAIKSDPFALVELYDDRAANESSPLMSVAVVRGESALAAHEALQPGLLVTLSGVRRQRWHVPQSFQEGKMLDAATSHRLKNRAPTHVFVVNDCASISWSKDSFQTKYTLQPLPSTPIPLVAIQGIVKSVRRANMGAAGETIYSVLIDCENENDSLALPPLRCKLYLSYYPISPSLIWGLRIGALIRAVNVYRVEAGLWKRADTQESCQIVLGASVRSTITILRTASDNIDRAPEVPASLYLTQAPDSSEMYLPPTLYKPYTFMNLKRTCNELEWRERLRSNWYDESKLSNLSEVPRFEEISRNLLVQHEKVQEGRVEKTSGVGRTEEGKKRKLKRDPYAEFFDQTFSAKAEEELSSSSWPIVFPLKRIRQQCVSHFKSLVVCATSDDYATSPVAREENRRIPLKSGWTASKCYDETGLLELMTGESFADHSAVTPYACGIAGENLSSLQDGSCQLPVCLALIRDDSFELKARLQAPSGMDIPSGTFLALPIHSIVVSCVCIGTAPNDSSPQSERIEFLPASNESGIPDVSGGCGIFVADGLIFLASVTLRWLGQQTVRNVNAGKKMLVTVKESLEERKDGSIPGNSTCDSGCSNAFTVGQLVRQRFALRKIQQGTYKGCILILSHVSITKSDQTQDLSFVCDLQSIELKLTAKDICNNATRQMKRTLNNLLRGVEEIKDVQQRVVITNVICDDQVGMATAWWAMSRNAKFSSILCGGRDESQTTEGLQNHVYLRIPLCSRETTRYGYKRFKCDVDDIVAISVHSVDQTRGSERTEGARSALRLLSYFDFVGGEKFLPGMLDRLPHRRRAMGDRTCLSEEKETGIPTRTLSELHWILCKDLEKNARISTSPSLVRRISGARLLGVSFCRARAECTRCFQFLIRQGNTKEAKSGVVTSVSVSSKRDGDANEGDTFWHLPLEFDCDGPSPNKKGAYVLPPGTSTLPMKKKMFRTSLRCPNECPTDFSAIKWECSGVIDDGTGQAKLYAEREAALALIGSGLDVKSIEEGAWAVESGINFQKSVPPRNFIRNSIQEAQMMAHSLQRDNPSPNKKPVQASDVLGLLTPEARAEYTLQRYCRNSDIPMRCMDIVCRCKPLSDGAKNLNRTDVEITTARCEEKQEAVTSEVITYTLPPLKLILVDLFCVSSTQREYGWSLARSMCYKR